jgi:tetratricopeptide (TPR) repeat protein
MSVEDQQAGREARLSDRRLCFLFAGSLAVLTALAYAPILRAGFLNFDDNTWVAANPHVNTGLRFANLKWAFTSVYASNYVPLTWMSHMADCQLFGLASAGHHAINLLFHLLNTVLFFLLVKRAVVSLWPAVIVTALFGLHPIHVESVAWVAERKDVLSAFFWLLACHAYFSYVAAPGPCRYAVVLVPFALGLLAKPMLVTFPFVLLLMDVWPLHRARREPAPGLLAPRAMCGSVPQRSWVALLLEKIPFALLTLGACLVTFVAQRSSGTMSGFTAYPLNLRLGNAAISYVAYLAKLFVPSGLPVVEPLVPHPLTSPLVLGAVVLLASITALALTQLRRRPYLAVGWFWYLGTLVPVIGIVQVGGQGLAYRYTYIPFLGISLALSQALADALASALLRERVLAVTGCIIALSLSALTWRQVHFWHDNETLYRYSLQHSRRNWMVLNNLGVYLATSQRYEEAIPCLQQVLMFNPGHFQAATTLGFALEHAGHEAEAVRAYQQVISVRPQDPGAYENLITVLIHSQRLDEGLSVSDRLLSLDPNRSASWVARGSVLLAAGRGEEAVKTFERALALDLSSDSAKYYLALACQQTGQPARAEQLLTQSLKLGETERLNRFLTLGAALRDLRKYQQSAEVFRQGLREFPNRAELVEPLAHVEYTFLKDYSNALPHLQLLLRLAPSHSQRATYQAAVNYVSKQLSASINTNAISK